MVTEMPRYFWTTSNCLVCKHIGSWRGKPGDLWQGWVKCDRWRSPPHYAHPGSHDVKHGNDGPCQDFAYSIRTVLKERARAFLEVLKARWK